MRRSQFYEFKRRFQTHGLDGLKDLPPTPKSHPMPTPEGVVAQILEMSLAHPAWGCVRLSNQFELGGSFDQFPSRSSASSSSTAWPANPTAG